MKRKSVGKKKSFTLPGDFLVKHIKYGVPIVDGVYACYFKPDKPSGWSSTFPCADMKMISFSDGKFFGNVHVLAWVGPLPVLCLDELKDNEKCINRVFSIGTLQGAAKNRFNHGPFPQYMLAYLEEGRKHDFIFELSTHKTVPNSIAKFSTIKGKWIKLNKESINKYTNAILKLKRKAND
jgi:hypothetical protein